MRFIIGECKRLGLKIWLLDDAHFPTGYANGALAGENVDPVLKKTVLKHRTVTVLGPQPSTVINLGNLMDPTERFVGAATFDAAGAPLNLEITLEQTDGGTPARLRFDAPSGIATVELYVTSQKTGFRDEYINMVDADSCRVLIDAVYEPTFEHLSDEFGCTILGFFTDEPGFMNEKGTALDDASTSSFIGRGDMALPWSDELASRLRNALGEDWLTKLHGLWIVSYTHLQMVVENRPAIDNAYRRGVNADGNPVARQLVEQVFEPCDTMWRGLGPIAASGLAIRPEFSHFDASKMCIRDSRNRQ